ncbi:hypothetical protein AVEN_226728-1 [Araneus ventricosus]|uniref:Uncharacterized protein n=1 Tax=Araneus ventricosus TaxID=182803 RepID=A0A4Y2S027_ARAVE|nr:hypothetical protein AVEN_226728-1 [Araneus ventricosus]
MENKNKCSSVTGPDLRQFSGTCLRYLLNNSRELLTLHSAGKFSTVSEVQVSFSKIRPEVRGQSANKSNTAIRWKVQYVSRSSSELPQDQARGPGLSKNTNSRSRLREMQIGIPKESSRDHSDFFPHRSQKSISLSEPQPTFFTLLSSPHQQVIFHFTKLQKVAHHHSS